LAVNTAHAAHKAFFSFLAYVSTLAGYKIYDNQLNSISAMCQSTAAFKWKVMCSQSMVEKSMTFYFDIFLWATCIYDTIPLWKCRLQMKLIFNI